MVLRLVLIAGILLCVGGCGKTVDNSYRQQLFAFGTLIDITLIGVDEAMARDAVQAIDSMYQQQHRDWHAWQRSQLGDLNQAIGDGHSVSSDASIIELIQLGQRFERLSHGLFNPSIGHLLRLWGFQQDEPPATPPTQEAISRWLATAPSSLQLDIDGNRVSSSNTAVKLDFGGFAKGYSVAKAVGLLENRGIHNLVVNAGGDLCLRGRHGDRPWRIGIRAPDGAGVLASIELEGAHCMFTSGDYERHFEYRGRRYHHILDPRSGYPAEYTRSVTVLAKDAALADAAATALFVAGPDDWQGVARAMGVSGVLLIDHRGITHMTDNLVQQVQFKQVPEKTLVIELDAASDV